MMRQVKANEERGLQIDRYSGVSKESSQEKEECFPSAGFLLALVSPCNFINDVWLLTESLEERSLLQSCQSGEKRRKINLSDSQHVNVRMLGSGLVCTPQLKHDT